MAADNPFKSNPQPAQASIFYNCLVSILGTGRIEPAYFIGQEKLSGDRAVKKMSFLIETD